MDREIINIENLLQKDRQGRQEKFSPNARQKKLVTALWSRMEQLFRAKWTSAEGPKMDDKSKFTENFLFWCQATCDLTDQQWTNAFKRIDQEIVSKVRSGDESWPPSYVAFLELTKFVSLSPDGKHAAAYKVFEPQKKLTDQGAIERTMSAHQKHMDAMKELRS